MNGIIISSYSENNVNSIINVRPDILFTNPNSQLGPLKGLGYREIEGLLYNPSRFKEVGIDRSVAQIFDLRDKTTDKVVSVVIPHLKTDGEALLNKLGQKNLHIVSDQMNANLNVFLTARGYVQESGSHILVKGAEIVEPVLNTEDRTARISLGPQKSRSWSQTFVFVIKSFFCALTFKLVLKIVMRFLFI